MTALGGLPSWFHNSAKYSTRRPALNRKKKTKNGSRVRKVNTFKTKLEHIILSLFHFHTDRHFLRTVKLPKF